MVQDTRPPLPAHTGASAFIRRWHAPLNAAVLAAIYAWSAICPADRSVWHVEMAAVLIVSIALALTARRFRFSNTAYFIVSLWLALHAIGAHYTFEKVPFGLISDAFGFERNHFDRVAHFVIGLNAFLAAEYFWRKGYVSMPCIAALIGILSIMGMSAAWEIIEWLYAVADGGATGAAFLGSQGDIWDAQQDMLADTLGAMLGSAFFLFLKPRNFFRKETNK